MEENIRKDYFVNKMSVRGIVKKYSISYYRFYKIIPKSETRSKSEAMVIWRKNNRQIMSTETKKKISESMKLAHSEGRHNGWSFINSNVDRRSYPEEFFHKFLSDNNLFEEHKIIEKMSFGKYFLDFAFLDKKLDVEIDGSQHYRNDEAILHDSLRDEFLNNNGWVVYRIKWSDVCKNTEKELNEFLEFLSSDIIKNRKYSIENLSKVCNKGKDNLIKVWKRNRKVKRPEYDKLIEEIKEFGYCEVGRKYGVSDNSIRKWIKYYEKYE